MIAETIGVFAGGYALLLGGLAVFQRDVIYHPAQSCPEPAKCGVPEMTPVPVRGQDGVMVTGWYAPPSTPGKLTVILFHGNGGCIADRAPKARILMDKGYGVLLAGYRGYGGNAGQPSERGLYMDARAAIGWLTNREVPEELIVLYGESLGTGVAVQMGTEHRHLAGLILESPYTCLPDLTPSYLFPGLSALMVDRFDTISKIASVHVPILVVHGEQDGIVPVSFGKTVFQRAWYNKKSAFIPGAGHTDVWDKGGAKAVLDFLQNPEIALVEEKAEDEVDKDDVWQGFVPADPPPASPGEGG